MSDEVVVGVHGGTCAPTVTAVDGRRQTIDRKLSRSESGAVTAEAAAVIPLLVALTIGLVWLVALAAAQVRVVDGAREVARAMARGEGQSTAVALGRKVAPGGTTFEVGSQGGTVRVHATAEVRGPGGLFAFLPSLTVESEAVAAQEPE